MPKISIIVPVYNVEKYLNRCIDSILNQTYKDFELILVDDGSTDNSGNICDIYARGDKRVRVIHKKNGGVSSARNVGLRNINCEYIVFIDGDDWIKLDYIEYLFKSITEMNDIDIVFTGVFKEYYEDSNIIKTLTESVSENIIIQSNLEMNCYLKYIFQSIRSVFLSPWSKIYKSSIIIENNIKFDDEMICFEDFNFNLKYLLKSKKHKISTYVGYHYYNNMKNSGIDKGNINTYDDILKSYNTINEYFNYIKCDNDIKEYFDYYFIDKFLYSLRKIAIFKCDYFTRKKVLKAFFERVEIKKLMKIYNLRFMKLINKLVYFKLYLPSFKIILKKL